MPRSHPAIALLYKADRLGPLQMRRTPSFRKVPPKFPGSFLTPARQSPGPWSLALAVPCLLAGMALLSHGKAQAQHSEGPCKIPPPGAGVSAAPAVAHATRRFASPCLGPPFSIPLSPEAATSPCKVQA